MAASKVVPAKSKGLRRVERLTVTSGWLCGKAGQARGQPVHPEGGQDGEVQAPPVGLARRVSEA